jgi:hypothetical protein
VSELLPPVPCCVIVLTNTAPVVARERAVKRASYEVWRNTTPSATHISEGRARAQQLKVE